MGFFSPGKFELLSLWINVFSVYCFLKSCVALIRSMLNVLYHSWFQSNGCVVPCSSQQTVVLYLVPVNKWLCCVLFRSNGCMCALFMSTNGCIVPCSGQQMVVSYFAQVKVVMLGQDPYHGPGQAHGNYSVNHDIDNP